MSAKNKHENKKLRREARENKTLRLTETQPSTDIPLDVSSAVLTGPKEKLSRASRQIWLRSRYRIFQLARKTKLTDVEVQTKRAKWLKLVQVLNRRFQAARRAATASNIARKLHESSSFRPAVIAEVQKQVNRCHVFQTELVNRNLVSK